MGNEQAGRWGWRTVQRSLAMLVWAGVFVATTSCWPQQPTSPAIVEAQVSTSPVVAGSTFTLTLTATATSEWDVGGITLMTIRNPSGGYLPKTASCPQSWATDTGPAPEKTVSWTCTIPDGAPNGTWLAQTRVYVEGLANRDLDVPFEVVGGANDAAPPGVTVTAPATVTAGTAFDFTVRFAEDHGPIVLADPITLTMHGVDGLWQVVNCSAGTWTTVDAATTDYTATCAVPEDKPVGRYDTPGWTAYDAFGQSSHIDLAVEVV